MKAIFLNIDEYVQPVVDWIKGGRVGPIPKPGYVLPVSVTIPLGQSAAVFAPGEWAPEEDYGETIVCSVDGYRISAKAVPSNVPKPAESTPIDYGVVPGFSKIGPEMEYVVWAETGNFSLSVEIMDVDTDEQEKFTVAIPVLVQFEKASGPVDLVDFTPPAAAPTAAQINAALGGTGAAEGQPLKGVSLANATNAPAPSAADINAALGGTFVDGKPLASVNIEGAVYGELNITTTEIDGTAVFSPSES